MDEHYKRQQNKNSDSSTEFSPDLMTHTEVYGSPTFHKFGKSQANLSRLMEEWSVQNVK